jgi:hypothetical protein
LALQIVNREVNGMAVLALSGRIVLGEESSALRKRVNDKWAIANTKRLVNTSLPPDVELGAGWDACIASLGRPAAQEGIKALIARGFHKPGDVEDRLGYYLGQIAR